MVQFLSTPGESQKSVRVSHMLEFKSGIDWNMENCKCIDGLPKAFDQSFGFVFPVGSFNVSKLSSDEFLIVADIN